MASLRSVSLRAYQVGFGDCFMLGFHYKRNVASRYMLIDFGTTGLPDGWPKEQMVKVAEAIAADCGGKLHAVVATHRHQDHIKGFATAGPKSEGTGKTSGEIIAGLEPDLVIMPWTENPDIPIDAKKALDAGEIDRDERIRLHSFVTTLADMQQTSRTMVDEAARLSLKSTEGDDGKGFLKPIDRNMSRRLSFMGENNLSNASAVKNLHAMGNAGQAHYVNYGYDLDVGKVFPEVKITVLGPPTVEQYAEVAKQRSKDPDEFWMLQGLHNNHWALQAATSDLLASLNKDTDAPDRIFNDAEVYDNVDPSETRWFTRRVRAIRAEQLMGLVRILDDALNNTSVILLIEAGRHKLLFPGDAQIENWEYALKHAPDKDRNLTLLRDTTVYKVGHHGSRNATPKTLWNNFRKKGLDDKESCMHTVISTLHGKHGHSTATAVPRATLVEAMKKESRYKSTEEIAPEHENCFIDIAVD